MINASKRANKLIDEKSPYLLQHAYNPVDWYSWSDEAFQKAKNENKPVFLSIGYSTCHWCHVMERESFEDNEVADYLNKYFINIKVDREERPDIDNIYMTFCQATMGQGGWPLSVFITPDKEPFYAGTYFPKYSRYGHPGFMDLLSTIKEKWDTDKDTIINSASEMTEMINSIYSDSEEEEIDNEIVKKAYSYFIRNYDTVYGGFGSEPKFPTPHNLLFLLRYYQISNNQTSLEMVEKTLIQMYKGGIFDHIGYGFSRYSTDKKWLVPHFEKMLYDNALLLMCYIECFQLTKKDIYKEISEKIIEYIIRDMTMPEGGFYCAEDADSEGIEGKYYVWSINEILDILGDEDGNLFCKYYDITKKGNFEGNNIPNLINTNVDEIENNEELKRKLEIMREKLLNYRNNRIKPHKDDKVLTSWNGLMIVALAKTGRILKNQVYIDYAKKSAEFIGNNLVRTSDNRLLSRFRDGEAKNLAYIDDYAFLIWAFIELYEATFEPEYIKKAINYSNDMINIFWDEDYAGFFMYGKDSEQLISRPKEIYDGAIPSGNSVASYALQKLSRITGEAKYEDKIHKLFRYFGSKINETPMVYSFMLISKMFADNPTKEVVLTSRENDGDLYSYIDILNNEYLPFSIVIVNTEDKNISNINRFVRNQTAIDGKATAYVCQNYSCQKPVNDIEEFRKLLNV